MENQNVCLFIPKQNNFEPIHTVHFVLETSPQAMEKQKILSMYRMHLVVEGEGILHLRNEDIHLYSGDIFFGLPAVPFSLEPIKDFKYMYVSYLGTRANYLTDKFRINEKNCVFRGFNELTDFWRNALDMDSTVAELRSESVVLYTFSSIGTKYYPSGNKSKEQTAASEAKKYIDDNFTNPELSLQGIAEALSYNPKYLSSLFKSAFKLGISDYITTIRIQHACALMDQGVSGVKNIAFLCGFNDPLYFSKVFKTKMGLSPREHLNKLQKR